MVALLICTKYEEIYPPEIRDLQHVAEGKFSRSEILYWEIEVLHVISFEVGITSPYFFLTRYRKMLPHMDDKLFHLAQYLQETCLLDASMLKFRPSEMAAAAMILAAKLLKRPSVWTKEV